MKRLLLFSALLFVASPSFSQQITGKELLEKTIQFHDPNGNWETANLYLFISDSSPKRKKLRTSKIYINNLENGFRLQKEADNLAIESGVLNDSCFAKIEGIETTNKVQEEKYRIGCERTKWTRNYYTYLYGLPMKLKDAGTIVSPKVKTTEFQGKSYLTLEVHYDSATGSDTWFFFINPKTYQMEGYKFYHNSKPDGGEYITLEGLTEVGGMKIPKKRSWYTNKERKFLGTDDIVESAKM